MSENFETLNEQEVLFEWIVLFYGALHKLVELKEIKETEGETEVYIEEKPKAWYLAKQALELWKKSDYGAKIPLRVGADGKNSPKGSNIIAGSRERFAELEPNYKFDWRSFYNGWIEGRYSMFRELFIIDKP